MFKQKIILIFLLSFTMLEAQEPINQTDAPGRRHGHWQTNFEGTSEKKFEGEFKHGKEIGEFKFYKKGFQEHPSAIMIFSEGSDTVNVTYYTQKGNPISTGKMLDKKREATWVIYHQNTTDTMQVEHYRGGELDGQQITYFPNGQITEIANYKEGKLHGSNQVFSENGQLLQDFNYQAGKLHGPVTYYNKEGEKIIEGQYKDDKKSGTWKYFEANQLKESIEY